VRGDIYELRSDRRATGHEQKGERFCVAVQDDYLTLSTVIVVPTSTSSFPADFHPTITLRNSETCVMAEQVMTFDLSRLKDRVGRVSPDEMANIERALLDVLGL
jgi:mRNA interferase MazF